MLGSVLPFNNRVGVAENPVVSIHFSCRSNSSATTVLFASISLLKNLACLTLPPAYQSENTLAHPTNPVECCADANPKTMLPNDT